MKGRLLQLDILRGVAVLLVLGRHLPPIPETLAPALRAVAEVWQRGGWIGVDLFFVLSGFLVSGLLFGEEAKTGSIRVGRFLIRRGLKIWPSFVVLWLFTVAYTGLAVIRGQYPAVPWKLFLGELFFLQNYLGGPWPHTWSLAVEEHFYLLLAALTAYLVHRRGRKEGADPFAVLPALFLLVATVCYGLRIWTNATLPYSPLTHVAPTHLRIDSLLYGVLLSYFWHRRGGSDPAGWKAPGWALIAVGALLLAPPFFLPLESTGWLRVTGPTELFVGAGALLIGLLRTPLKETLAFRALAGVGVYSYSIYLWHLPLVTWIIPSIAPNLSWTPFAISYVIGSVLLGIAMSKGVEYPILRLRDRWLPSPSASMVA